MYGLHPNAEIGTLTTRSENLFQTLMEMQPRDAVTTGGTGISRDEKVNTTLFMSNTYFQLNSDFEYFMSFYDFFLG